MLKLLGERELELIYLDFLRRTEPNGSELEEDFFQRKRYRVRDFSAYSIEKGREIYSNSIFNDNFVNEYYVVNKFDRRSRCCVVRVVKKVVTLDPKTKQPIAKTLFDEVVERRKVSLSGRRNFTIVF